MAPADAEGVSDLNTISEGDAESTNAPAMEEAVEPAAKRAREATFVRMYTFEVKQGGSQASFQVRDGGWRPCCCAPRVITGCTPFFNRVFHSVYGARSVG